MATERPLVPDWTEDPYVKPWPEMRAFWEAAAIGRFLMPRCDDCGQHHWHPRAVCPFCRSSRISWIEASGRGSIFSYSVARTRIPPHVVAFVRTAEGPVMLTQIINCPIEKVYVGQNVRVKLSPVEGGRAMPFFEPEP